MAMQTRPSRLSAIVLVLAIVPTVPILWRVALPMLDGTAWPKHAAHLQILLIHTIGGLSMLVLGAMNLYIGTTRRMFQLHRWVGYGYFLVGSVGAVAALAISFHAPHAPHSLYIATGTLAVVWLAVAAMAWRAARNRRFASHREWMIRSYVLSWTFVGCRIATMVDIFPWLGAESTTAAIWMNWIIPLVVCEIMLRWQEGAVVPTRPSASPHHS